MANKATSPEAEKVRTNTRSKEFDKLYDKLSKVAKELVDGALGLYLKNPSHPGLRTHKLKDSKKGRHHNGSVSISASRHVSAICVPLQDTNLWYWVGSHEAYNGFTGSGRH
jgi:hypothetical protein